jgi:hypothetical protein
MPEHNPSRSPGTFQGIGSASGVDVRLSCLFVSELVEEPAMTRQPIASDDDLDPIEEQYVDEEGEPGFERIRRTTSKAPSPKLDRRQQDKEWGKAINKHHKERKRFGGREKP